MLSQDLLQEPSSQVHGNELPDWQNYYLVALIDDSPKACVGPFARIRDLTRKFVSRATAGS